MRYKLKEKRCEVEKYGKKHLCLKSEIPHFDLNSFYSHLLEIKDEFSLTTLYFTQTSKNYYLIWVNVYGIGQNWIDKSYVLTLGTIKHDEISSLEFVETEKSTDNKRVMACTVDHYCWESRKKTIVEKMKGTFAS